MKIKTTIFDLPDYSTEDWFAWRPVLTETGHIVWREVVERTLHDGGIGSDYYTYSIKGENEA
jgi:hypothetical protein